LLFGEQKFIQGIKVIADCSRQAAFVVGKI